MKPFVKWAGGKRQILNKINEYLEEESIKRYIEPFLGGGAVFFSLKPNKAIINDLNHDLMNVYRVLESNEYEMLISKLREYQNMYQDTDDKEGFYYEIRQIDREDNWEQKYSDVDRAARMVFLNKTCYNGLYRVNNKGQFNTPIGRYKRPLICDEENLREIHDFLSQNKITIKSESYEKILHYAKPGDYIYIDPPYDYEDNDGFTKYQMHGFDFNDFKLLKKSCDSAIEKGAFVVISNNATRKVLNLFENDANYKIYTDINKFKTLRSINCKGNNRKTGNEVIICGMNCSLPQANDLSNIIKLLVSGKNSIKNKDKAKKILNVTSDRQVSYYLSALFYLGIIDKKRNIRHEYIGILKNEKEIKRVLFKTILNKEPFKSLNESNLFINKKITSDEIYSHIKNSYSCFSKATLERRASTIKAWIEYIQNDEIMSDMLKTLY